jgi:hypothetical protein
MHKILQDFDRTVLSLSRVELLALTAAVEDACARGDASDSEIASKYGLGGQELSRLVDAMKAEVHPSRSVNELVQVWEDQGAVMMQVMNTHGDPVEMGEMMASEFAEQLRQAIDAS